MCWLQIVLFTLFICITSSTNLARNESDPGTLVNSPFLKSINDITYFGQVPIYYYGDGMICSGVHLKPWIILTVGSCIVGRDPDLLYIDVTATVSVNFKNHVVGVQNFEIHPYRQPNIYTYDFGLMIIHVPKIWIGGRYYMPGHDYSVAELRKFKLIVSEWQCGGNQSPDKVSNVVTVRDGVNMCGDVDDPQNWYCVERGNNYPYYEMDRGDSLFYFYTDSYKVLLGMYMGDGINQSLSDRFFHRVRHIHDWVHDIMGRYTVPPPPPPEKKSVFI